MNVGNRQPWPQPKEAGRANEKPKGKGNGKGRSGGKAKGKGKGLTCYVCGGLGTPRSCAPVKDGLTTWSRTCLREKTPMKKVAPTEEDDETLQLGYFGSDSCLMSSPPGLCDASVRLDGPW